MEGFPHTDVLKRKDLRRGVFVVLARSLNDFEMAFDGSLEPLEGVIITSSDEARTSQLASHLLHVQVPFFEDHTTLRTLAATLAQVACKEWKYRQQAAYLQARLDRADHELKEWSEYSEQEQAALTRRYENFTEWTVTALQAVVDFNARRVPETSKRALPQTTVDFLMEKRFRVTGAAIFEVSASGDERPVLLAHAGSLDSEITIPHLDSELVTEGNCLYITAQSTTETHLIVLQRDIPESSEFHTYEKAFFELFAIGLAAEFSAKSLQENLRIDLEERRRTEAALALAMKAKDEFLARMSHELRTPLNVVLGQAQLMTIGAHGEITDKQKLALGTIDQSGRHLLALINDVLDLSKLDAEAETIEPEPVDIQSLVNECLNLLKDSATHKGIRLSCSMELNLPSLEADPRRLKQILINLISNAIKFTAKEGRVGIDIGVATNQKEVHFSVWDTGIGISDSQLQFLFQPFMQVDSSLAREYEGSGLGLALVDQLTRLHKGRVTVQSELGEGSRFTVHLPIHQSPPNPPRMAAPPQATPQPIDSATPQTRVLVAEDNEGNRALLGDFLRYEGYEVFEATNGREAVELATRKQPELIFMDVQMPLMDGLEATRILKEKESTRDIPIVALTGLAMAGDKDRCLEAGCDRYLSKPFDLDALLDLVKELTPDDRAQTPR